MIARVIDVSGPQTAARGMMIGALLCGGLVAAAMATEYAFEARSLQIFAITAGYPILGGLGMGAIAGAWKR